MEEVKKIWETIYNKQYYLLIIVIIALAVSVYALYSIGEVEERQQKACHDLMVATGCIVPINTYEPIGMEGYGDLINGREKLLE